MNGASASVRNSKLDCCGGLNNIDFTKVDVSVMADTLQNIILMDTRFWVAVAAIVFNPFFWNVVARWEHRTRILTRLFGGPYVACYSLAFLILLLNVYRSHCLTHSGPSKAREQKRAAEEAPTGLCITVAMNAQPRCDLLDTPPVFYAGSALMALGSILVVSSFFALGFTGTFLGDYFGILMEEKVTGFPFSIMENPMYWGSTANYLGLALINASPTGIVLTAVVALTYQAAILFEGPFTEEIYRQRMRGSKQQ